MRLRSVAHLLALACLALTARASVTERASSGRAKTASRFSKHKSFLRQNVTQLSSRWLLLEDYELAEETPDTDKNGDEQAAVEDTQDDLVDDDVNQPDLYYDYASQDDSKLSNEDVDADDYDPSSFSSKLNAHPAPQDKAVPEDQRPTDQRRAVDLHQVSEYEDDYNHNQRFEREEPIDATDREARLQDGFAPSPPPAPQIRAPRPDLPSFEATPIPLKPTLHEWQEQRRRERAQKEVSAKTTTTMEFSSTTFLPSAAESSAGPRGLKSGYVAICAIVRDAHDDLLEWVHHHLKLGMYPVYLYDHASAPPMSSVVRQHIDSGAVVYRQIQEFHHPSGKPQLWAYDDCLQRHGTKHKWLAFIDVDEFLIFKTGPPVQSLPDLLREYENYSALVVHWILFGSSGHETRPSRGVLRSYFRCLPQLHTQHLFVKTIANTACTMGTTDSPHAFRYNCTNSAVRTDRSPIHGPTAEDAPLYATLAIHHYATKSQEEFEVKMVRGSGMKRQR
jgi:hypothetical protein